MSDPALLALALGGGHGAGARAGVQALEAGPGGQGRRRAGYRFRGSTRPSAGVETQEPAPNPVNHIRITRAVERELQKKGLKPSGTNPPDLRLHYFGYIDKKIKGTQRQEDTYQPTADVKTIVDFSRVKEGTLILELFAAHQREAPLEGRGHGGGGPRRRDGSADQPHGEGARRPLSSEELTRATRDQDPRLRGGDGGLRGGRHPRRPASRGQGGPRRPLPRGLPRVVAAGHDDRRRRRSPRSRRSSSRGPCAGARRPRASLSGSWSSRCSPSSAAS